MGSRAAIVAGGCLVYGAATYATFQYMRISKLPVPSGEIADPAFQRTVPLKERDVYASLAPRYDAEVCSTEWLAGITGRRRELLRRAEGDVLEVSAGTAANLGFYPLQRLRSLTLSDASEAMLAEGRRKHERDAALRSSLAAAGVRVAFVAGDAQRLPYDDGAFDTVVDTFGLCSCEDPVAALREMRRVCKPSGRVLLLEHGQGHYDFLNSFLHRTAAEHAERYGCWYNRDISELVRAAGLRPSVSERTNFGTTYLFVIPGGGGGGAKGGKPAGATEGKAAAGPGLAPEGG